MDQMEGNNYIRLCGYMDSAPDFSHSSQGLDYYLFPLRVKRLSGAADTLNILLRRDQLALLPKEPGEKLSVVGEVRSFNSRRGSGARLVITVLAREIAPCAGEDDNRVVLIGTLCKAPNPRTTPMGREICDLMLAVNRRYGRSDYLPCICWGGCAREAADWPVGARLRLEGRLQSRDYIKLTGEGPVHRTAFEISAAGVTRLPDSTE